MSTDVVDVVKDEGDVDGGTVFVVVQRSEEHTSEKLGRPTLITNGQINMAGIYFRNVVVGIV